MKKTLLVSTVGLAVVLFSCDANQGNEREVLTIITMQQAKDIALDQVSSGTITKVSYDEDDLIPTYEITLIEGMTEYEFEISAIDGTILKQEQEFKSSTVASPVIDSERAKEIVLSQITGTVTEIVLEEDDEQLIYEVKATATDDTYQYRFEISATDGTILKEKQERLYQVSTSNSEGSVLDINEIKEKVSELVPHATITEISLELDHLMNIYEVEVSDGTYEYDYEFNAADGNVISCEKTRI
ncbi:MAG: PepSY domain-containing protein [Turicibacter sp.]|nr:PepSY domain-containing protein [Turicibacter sp.]